MSPRSQKPDPDRSSQRSSVHTAAIARTRDARRTFIKGLSASIAVMLTGCAPVRYFTRAYNDSYCSHAETRCAFLHAFVAAVVPGCGKDADNIRIFTDPAYPFAEHLPYFLADVARRSQDIRGHDRFDLCTLEERTAVIASGRRGDMIAEKLYTAAIFMAQVSVYAGIYDPEKGSPLIDFPGANTGYERAEMCYADNERYIRNEMTSNGIVQ